MDPKEQILAWIEQDREELVRFLSAFVAIPSPNPPGDTRDAARFLADRLRREGTPVEIRSAKALMWWASSKAGDPVAIWY
jgi:succinyl-diaminopimelate desuccinylase